MPRTTDESGHRTDERGAQFDGLVALARGHKNVRPGRGSFVRRPELDQLDKAFSRVKQQLDAKRHPDPGVRTAAEWLLDNEYLLNRVLRQLRGEFPSGFQEHLPRLTDSGQPRILSVAEALYGRPAEFDVDALDTFLEVYQQETPLRIAELWALPTVLRLVIVRQFRDVLVGAVDESEDAGETSDVDAGSAAGRAVRAMRFLAELDWKEVFSRHSATEQVLRKDPVGAYDSMDFETRDSYRRAVESIAFVSDLEELEVARAAVARAREAPPDGLREHVGYWLVGSGRRELEEALGVESLGLERRLRAHPNLTFFGILAAAQILVLAPVVAYLVWIEASAGWSAAAMLLVLLPSTVATTSLTHWFVSSLLTPGALPKLDFSDGIPTKWKTLVAVPTLLAGSDDIDDLLDQLETHYLSNPDPQLTFALLTDHLDTEEPPGERYEARLAYAKAGIRRLNDRHGGERDPFHLLHRESKWNPSEGKWMGWERKRGKLEELNHFLRGDDNTTYADHAGSPDELEEIAFVITLDSDTELPPGAAARMIGALAHPLNRPRADSDNLVRSGYAILQPRVEISPRSARVSTFTRIFSGDTGIDIYTRAVSEVYQDLFGEGNYVGKGIYDVDAFRESLEERVPENSLLSHDLFEGAHARAALATDIVVYEDYPAHYPAYLHRKHRWVRGDWQLLPWLGWRAPKRGGGTVPNRLGLLNQFKILDNLRRSLISPSVFLLVVSGWFLLPGAPWFWVLVAVSALGIATVRSALTDLASMPRELGRWFLLICFIPQETRTIVDAIGRSLGRMWFTGRRLLEWKTAAHASRSLQTDSVAGYFRQLWSGPVAALVIGSGLYLFAPGSLWAAAPLLVLWLVSPELARRISLPYERQQQEALDAEQVRTLRRYARRTWLFFETFVGPEEHWLPPDHFQESPKRRVAHRTSPTNIGMFLSSQLAAYDLGYLGRAGLATWASNTLDALEELNVHRGHIYNWYDTRTLEPLEPRYVSTVDSGNLAGSLLTLAEGCQKAAEDPPFRPAQVAGLRDVAELLAEAVDRWAQGAGSDPAAYVREASQRLVELFSGFDRSDDELFERAQSAVDDIEQGLVEGLAGPNSANRDPSLLRELRVWLEGMNNQLSEARQEPHPDNVAERLQSVADRAREFAEGMDFGFLYDEDRRLFAVGYNVSADRRDPHHYDLLASEARLASFLAVVWRQVPLEHWFALGRPLTRLGRLGRTLLSWGGSMFEYLMPNLLMRSHPDTLLSRSCEAAIARQIEYGKQHGTPWGISESGYAFLDERKHYQYRSFGVPGLGLRRGLEEDVVVAPYASFLALPIRPEAVMQNLEHLDKLEMLGRFGFYEAIDFHPRRAPGDRPARVQSHMAHHQGMSLVAIDNQLNDGVMVERFHADPHVRSGALLLDERVPRDVAAERLPDEETETFDVGLTPPETLTGWEPSTDNKSVWALGNGALTAMITARGSGGLRWRDLQISRWTPDPVEDPHGTAIYLRDLDSDEIFGATPWPVGDWPQDAHVGFEAGAAEFSRRHRELAIRTRITVASGEDVELREIEIANVGDRARNIEVVGSLEPLIAPEDEAARHPAFNKLFLRCARMEELAGVLVTRMGEFEGHPPPKLLFRMFGDSASAPRVVAIDRGAFLGRHGSMQSPAGLFETDEAPAEQSLDPMCACASRLTLPPGSRRVVGFVTAVAPSPTEVLDLGRRFGKPGAVRWAIEDSERAAARRLNSLDVSPDLLPVAQRLLSGLTVPDVDLRSPKSTLAEAHPSQQKLWARGVSGDDPIVLVEVDSDENLEQLTDVLDIHRYFRSIGVTFDLVIIDRAATGYGDQGADAVRRFLADRGVAKSLHKRGGIHVIQAEQVSNGYLVDLRAAAHVTFDARTGSLQRQLADHQESAPELPPFEPAGPPPGATPNPELTLDVPELEYDNGYGGFDGHEYVVRPGVTTPAPWSNVIANQQVGCLTTEAALGSTWSLNAGENRLTPWHNDPIVDRPSEALYLRDEETGRVWTTTPQPAGPPAMVRHGQGYTTYESVVNGLEQTMTVFVPPDAPLKVVRLEIQNRADRPRRLTATYYAEWVLGTRRDVTRAYIIPDVSVDDACLLAKNSWSMDFAGRVAFLASNQPLHGWTTDRIEMLGRTGGMEHPAGLYRWGLSGRVEPGLDPCAALQVHLDLAPNGGTEVCFFLGQVEDREAALETVRHYRQSGAVETAWKRCRQYWDENLEAVRVDTPDESLDRLCNRWLMYQSLSSRFFGRTAFYQSSGAFGFRDQLQDAIAFVHFAPELTRQHLLEAAAHQFTEGDVLHWWHPPGDAGVRTRCSDDLLWLVYATAEYVEATGDVEVLHEEVPFLAGEELGPGEETNYGRFRETESKATLLEHCRRAVQRASTSGPHGLPLIGSGDWNDGMDEVGADGRGESVWMGWFLYQCTEQLASMLERLGESDEAQTWRERLPELREALRDHAWDGDWYLRAFHDDGTAIGSEDSAPPHIDSIAQSWAALSGAGDPDRIDSALDSLEERLVQEDERLVLLLAPPFGPEGPDPGYIAEYPAGVRENGGQYTHAAAWVGFAHALRGDGAAAHRIFSLLNPLERTQSKSEVQRYCVEPYVVAADVYARPPWVGRGGWTWYTGSAAWVWRLAIEAILGIRRRDGELEVSPCIPADWPGFEATISEHDATVRVVVHNDDSTGNGVKKVEFDGETIEEPKVALDFNGEHRLEVWLGDGSNNSSR